MSKPTPLSPWFVVMQIRDDGSPSGDYLPPYFYTEEPVEASSIHDTDPNFTHDETKARLFNSIHSAYRVASANGAYCVAIADEAGLKEFRPNGV